MTQESKTITGAGTFVTSMTYDAADRVRTLTYPDGEVVTHGYSDPRGVLNTVSGWSSYVNSSSYNALGQVTQQSYNGWNSTSASWSYRGDNFRLDNYQVNSAWYGNQLNLSYSYDAVGNVKTISDGSNSNQVQTFTYDALNRLTSASTNAVGNGQYSESYSYNPIGNLLSKSDLGSYSYPPSGANSVRPHAVTSVGGYSYSYDANGNMLTRSEWSGSHTQGWDVENHLTSDTNGANSVTFTYDGDGKRVKKVESSGVTTAYVGNYYEWKSSGGVVKYYYASGKRVAMRTSSSIWDVSYLFGDHLGSTSLATNAYGYQTSRLGYKPFGGTAWFTAVLPTDYGFTGQRYEGTTGYIYDFGARYYDEYIGRFISADTIVPNMGNPQDFNRYSYTRNNPLRYTDPSGHCLPVCLIVGVALAVAVWEIVAPYNATPTGGDKVNAQGQPCGSAGCVSQGPSDFEVAGNVARDAAVAYTGARFAAAIAAGLCFNDGDCTNEAQQGLSAFSRAADFGIKSINELRKLTKGEGLNAHHIIEERFATTLGLDPGKMSGIALTPEEHQVFTNAWRQAIGYIGDKNPITTANATREQIWAAAQEIYAKYPELLEAARQTLFGK